MSDTWTGRFLRVVLGVGLAVGACIATAAPPAVVEAAPLIPDCLGDDDDDTDVDCLPYSSTKVKPVTIGSFGQGNLTIRTSFTAPPCQNMSNTASCYFSVDLPRFDGCFYIDEDEPEGVKSCGSYRDMYLTPPSGPSSDHFSFSSGTATSFEGSVTDLTCQGSFNTVFFAGGDLRTDFVWPSRGPNLANCDIEVNLPVPDKLQGTTFLRVSVGGRYCPPNSRGSCELSSNVRGYAWLPVFGTLDPALGIDDGDDDETDDETEDAPIETTEPSRIADSRADGETSDGQAEGEGLVEAGTSRRIAVTGRADVPDGARGVVLNAVAVGPDRAGYLTLYPCDEDVPSTSSVNFERGQVVANSAVVQLSGDGDICVFSSADVHVVVDVTGYLGENDAIRTIVPTRLVETREGFDTDDGEFEEIGRVEAGEPLEVEIAGRGDIPHDADAIAANLTVVDPDGVGYATIYPCDDEPPNASNVNYRPGDVRANSAIVPLDDDGNVCVYSSASTDVIIDVTATVEESDDFEAISPVRLLETRSGFETIDGAEEGEGRLEAGETIEVPIGGRGGLPDDLGVVAVNMTVVDPFGDGYVTAYPCDTGRGDTSSVNFGLARDVANSGILRVSDDATLCVYAHESVHMLVDVTGVGR